MNNENLKDYDENNEPCSCGCGDEHNHEHGDSCDCGCEDHEDGLTVDLEDEDGKIVSCKIVDGFKFKEDDYAVVQHPENESVYLFKVVGEGDTGELVIPEDDEFEEASKYYETLE